MELAGDVAVGVGTNGRFNPTRSLAFLRARRLPQQLIRHTDQRRRFSQNLLDGAGYGHSTQRGRFCSIYAACAGDIFVRNGRFTLSSTQKLAYGTQFNPVARRLAASRRRRHLHHHPQSRRVCPSLFTPLSSHFCGLLCYLASMGNHCHWASCRWKTAIINY